MPLDPSIILGARGPAPVQAPNPLDLIQSVAQLQGIREQTEQRRLAGEKARQQAQDEAAFRSTMNETGGDVEKALPLLRARVPHLALALDKQVTDQRKAHVETVDKELQNQKTQLDHLLKVWGLVGDQSSLEAIRPMFVKTFPDLDPVLPKDYGDGSAVQRVSDLALTRKEQLEQKQTIVKLFSEGKVNEAIGTGLSMERTAEGWDRFKAGAKAMGAPQAILDAYGDWSPEAPAAAAQRAITPKERETLAGQTATRAQTERHQTTQEDLMRAGQAQTAAAQAANLQVAQGHLAVAQAAEKRQEAAAGKGPKLSPAQQEEIATMLTVEELAQDVQTIDKKSGLPGVGPFQGSVFPSMRGSGGDTGETLRDKLGNIQGTIAKLRGGTSFTPNEQKLLESYTPTLTDRDATIRTKLTNLRDFIKKKREATLRVAAGDYTLPAAGTASATTTDTKKVDPLGIR